MNTGLWDEYGRYVTSQGSFNFTIDGDTGTAQTVENGETANWLGGASIGTVASATNTITINSIWDYESVLVSSGSFDIDLTAIAKFDSTVKSIILEFSLRSDVSATTDSAYISLNTDTTNANYYRQIDGATAGAAAVAAAADRVIGLVCGNTSPANAWSSGTITLSNPLTGQLKNILSNNFGGLFDTASARNDGGVLIWKSTATVNRIAITTDNSPTDLFLTGSYVRLRLIK